MTVKEFLLHHTKANELIMIQSYGYNQQAVWIDHEDLFDYHPRYADLEVKREYYDVLIVIDNYGNSVKVPCHYVNTEAPL